MFQNNHHKNALKTYKNEVELQKVRCVWRKRTTNY